MKRAVLPLTLAFILAFIFVLLLCLTPESVAAADRPKVALSPMRPLTVDCVADAAREQGLPLAALFGILAAENGRIGEALGNANGTWDLGAYQVNTVHIKALLQRGINAEAVLRDGCVNARAAAWVLRREYERTGDIWTAIGAYHSRTPDLRDAYIGKVRKHLMRLGAAATGLVPGAAAAGLISGAGMEAVR